MPSLEVPCLVYVHQVRSGDLPCSFAEQAHEPYSALFGIHGECTQCFLFAF